MAEDISERKVNKNIFGRGGGKKGQLKQKL